MHDLNHKIIHKKNLDPRNDLTVDHSLWEHVLRKALKIDENIYGILHGLRCGGSKLFLGAHSLIFNFSEEFTNSFKNHIKKKYINPNKQIIQKIFHDVFFRIKQENNAE